MLKNNKTAAIVAVAATALTLASCSSNGTDNIIPEPSFAPLTSSSSESESTSSSASESTAASSSSSATGTATSSASTTSGASGSANAALDNGDGTYRLIQGEPGPGPTDNLEAIYRNIEGTGFSELTVDPESSYMNGPMQYVLETSVWDYNEFYLELNAVDMQGNTPGGTADCRIDFELYDANGAPLPVGKTQGRGGCSDRFSLDLDVPGDQTVVAKIYQPGYEPLVIKQNIKVFE